MNLSALEELEATVERGLCYGPHFAAAGDALSKIKSSGLHKAAGELWDAYCRRRWDRTPQHIGRIISAARVVENLLSEPLASSRNGFIPPTSESQLRPLRCLSPEQQRQVWFQATANGHTPTRVEVAAAVNGHAEEAAPRRRRCPRNDQAVKSSGIEQVKRKWRARVALTLGLYDSEDAAERIVRGALDAMKAYLETCW